MTDPLLEDLMVLRMAVSSRDVESEWDKLVACAESIVQRGVKKSIAEWEADSNLGQITRCRCSFWGRPANTRRG